MLSLFDQTGTIAVAPMTPDEARQCADDIHAGIVSIGRKLLELYEREGWRALGYESWRECAQSEFGFKQSHTYRLLAAAEVERNISPIGENQTIPESHLRPLASLPPDQQPLVYGKAVETAPNGKVTAAHVQSVVDEYEAQSEELSEEPDGYDWTEDEPTPEPAKPHVTHNSGNNEWHTPAIYVEAARAVLGAIDLDPASNAVANATVLATTYYSAEDDGLLHEWRGRGVFMNPPYSGDLVSKFADKLVRHYTKGDVATAIVLVNNATETQWFQSLAAICSAICFPKSRIRFVGENEKAQTGLQGQAFIYIGLNVDSFAIEFGQFGLIVRPL
jgi:ParB family chromosome partitioning protein